MNQSALATALLSRRLAAVERQAHDFLDAAKSLPFEVGASTRRGDAKYCQNACKSKAYRGRRERARTLRTQGASLRAIARELNTDTKTVKKWVTQ